MTIATTVRYPIPPSAPAVPCKGAGCAARIHFIPMPSGRNMPVDVDGTPHWASCPASEQFKAHKQLEDRLAAVKRGGW